MEEDEFEEEEEDSEEEPEGSPWSVIDETPSESGFTQRSLQEITPVLDQAETGGSLESVGRRFVIQDDDEQEQAGVYEADRAGGVDGAPQQDVYRTEGAFDTADYESGETDGYPEQIGSARQGIFGQRRQQGSFGPSMGEGGMGQDTMAGQQGVGLEQKREYESDQERKRREDRRRL